MVLVVAFSSLARILGECLTIHAPLVLFFLKVEISLCTLIPFFMPESVHSGSVSWDCGWTFPDKLSVSSFLDRFPHYAWPAAWSAHSDFAVSRVYVCLGVTCHLHFWQNDWGLFVPLYMGVEWTTNKSLHTKVTLKKKILPPLLPGFELATFFFMSLALLPTGYPGSPSEKMVIWFR